MTEPTITCRNSKTEIKLTESLPAPLIEATRREFEQRLAQKDADVSSAHQQTQFKSLEFEGFGNSGKMRRLAVQGRASSSSEAMDYQAIGLGVSMFNELDHFAGAGKVIRLASGG